MAYQEGAWVGAGEPMCYITGPFSVLVDLETILLQRLGAACVAAYNAFNMCVELPEVSFLAMDARHCAGSEMAELMAYGASVGSEKARSKTGAMWFIGCAADGRHISLAGNAVLAPSACVDWLCRIRQYGRQEIFHQTVPDAPLTVLVDYFGQEITDALAAARRFPELAAEVALQFVWTHMAAALSRSWTRSLLCGSGTQRAAGYSWVSK